jgi:predicted DNA repair protein MutK
MKHFLATRWGRFLYSSPNLFFNNIIALISLNLFLQTTLDLLVFLYSFLLFERVEKIGHVFVAQRKNIHKMQRVRCI